MNAAEQVTNFQLASKIPAVVTLFKAEFPDARADLKPWLNDQDTRELIDPDSIDFGFHFPGRSRLFQCRSILVQVRSYTDPLTDVSRIVGIEVAGFDHQGKQWQLSTIDNWQFLGETCPETEAGERIKHFCRQVLELFNGC